jgi:hypothetical protein
MVIGRFMAVVGVVALMMGAPVARAHDAWADGSPVPEWVKNKCCGENEAHHIAPGDISEDAEGYHVRGYKWPIPRDKALPSLDGEYWLFYPTYWGDYGNREKYDGLPQCFFIPVGA